MTLFVDHSGLVELNQSIGQASQFRAPTEQEFWATPDRPNTSEIQEVLEVGLGAARLVNWIEFDTARFPHVLTVQYLESAGQWKTATDIGTQAPALVHVLQSQPVRFSKATAVPGHLHPQHSYLNHWEPVSLSLEPVKTTALRLVLKRTIDAAPPQDPYGNPSAYSLAVMNLNLGYRIASIDDVPRTGTRLESLTTNETFATTSDLLGSSVLYSVRTNRAQNITSNTDDDAAMVWKSEPQPYPNAVVNFYADLRDEMGVARTIDRIFIDPVYTGAHLSLYYSNDVPISSFDQSNATPLRLDEVAPTGDVALKSDFLHLGDYGTTSYVSLPNSSIGFDQTLPYWIGLHVRPNFTQGVDTDDHVVMSFADVQIALTETGVRFTAGLDTVEVEIPYYFAQDIGIIASCDGTSLGLRVDVNNTRANDQINLSSPVQPLALDQIVIGADLEGTFCATVDLYELVIKEEAQVDEGFFDFPDQYSTVSQFAVQDNPMTANALVRFDSTAALAISDEQSYSGFFATRPLKYEAMSWTPIPRDYVMQRGWMKLPVVSAKFINFEITNLQAEFREVYIATSRRVKRFPAALIQDYQKWNSVSGSTVNAIEDQGIDTAQQQPTGQQYADYPSVTGTGGTLTGYSATETYVAQDYAVGENLSKGRGAAWAYREWHTPVSAPRWTQVGTHPYSIDRISQTTKVAYFAGLRQVRFARHSLTSIQDVDQYVEPFLDANSLVESNWVADPSGALNSGSGTHTQAVSTTFPSVRDLRGLQFAAQQSSAQQLLLDPDFADPQHQYWSFIGDASEGDLGRFDRRVNTTLSVSREARLGHYEDIETLYGTYGAVETAGLTYGMMQSTQHVEQNMGGVASQSVAQPYGGQLYAAARVIAPKKLTSPLWVQIVDSVTDEVMSEAPMTINKDQVAEWYTSFGTGQGGEVTPNTWGDLTHGGDTPRLSMFDTFDRADASDVVKLDSGQNWYTHTSPLHIVSNKAVVNSVGDGSYFDTNLIWGSLSVTLGNAITTTIVASSVPMIDLGGWVLMNDGRVISSIVTDSSASRYTMATNDVLRFDFVPTNTLSGPTKPAGADAILTPYAMVVYRNGSFVVTLLSGQEPVVAKGLLGQTSQTYAGMTWTPGYAEIPQGESIPIMGMPDGALTTDGTAWIDANGHEYRMLGTWNFTKGPANYGSIHTAQPTSTLSGASHDFGSAYGSLSFRVAQLATGVDPATYPVATLDGSFTTNLQLLANGTVARDDGTIIKSGVVPSVTAGGLIVRYIQTKYLSSGFKTTYSIGSTDTQAMIFVQSGSVVGVVSGTGLWSGGVRGINGYNDGAGHYTIHEGFGWSPDASQVTADVRSVTYGSVSHNGTLTYGEMSNTVTLNTDPITVRVVQKSASQDVWELDNVSLYYDPIVWEFSNDDALTWVRALDIRNNPKGVLIFPPPVQTTTINAPSNKLRWRVTSYGPNTWVSHLTIRPWYLGQMRGTPVRSAATRQGPNLNPRDHYLPITDDPHWKVWNSPIPQDWWFAYRDLDPSHLSDATTPWITLTVGDSVVMT